MQQWRIPEDLLYDRGNLWVKMDGGEALVGLTDYGQYTTGDIVYLDLVSEGCVLDRGDSFGSIESGKWVGKLVMPVAGEVIAVNHEAIRAPRLVNSDPYARGWLVRVRLAGQGIPGLLDAARYAEWVAEQVRLEEEERMLA